MRPSLLSTLATIGPIVSAPDADADAAFAADGNSASN
jgi:hypothetical protein